MEKVRFHIPPIVGRSIPTAATSSRRSVSNPVYGPDILMVDYQENTMMVCSTLALIPVPGMNQEESEEKRLARESKSVILSFEVSPHLEMDFPPAAGQEVQLQASYEDSFSRKSHGVKISILSVETEGSGVEGIFTATMQCEYTPIQKFEVVGTWKSSYASEAERAKEMAHYRGSGVSRANRMRFGGRRHG